MIGYHTYYPDGQSKIVSMQPGYTGDYPVSLTTEEGMVCLRIADIPSLRRAIVELDKHHVHRTEDD